MRPNTEENILDKLKEKTIITEITNCWLWQGGTDSAGYGMIRFKNQTIGVHRVSAYLHLDLDLENKELCALHRIICTNKNCWNPEHLYIGTRKDNIRDIDIIGREKRGRYKTHCPKGHEYTPENTRIDKKGAQTCRECNRLRYYYAK